MKKSAWLHLFLCAGLCLAAPVHAQGIDPTEGVDAPEQSDSGGEEEDDEESSAEETDDNRRFWQAGVPGGHYMVALDRIASISMHQYVLDGQLLVNEMVIDTNGRSLARFYHVTTVAEGSNSATARKVVERGQELLDRAGQRAGTNAHNLAQKNYPTTSHAGMVEYRILDLRDLDALHRSVKSAWETGRGRRITLK
jgi:hypothetical protein